MLFSGYEGPVAVWAYRPDGHRWHAWDVCPWVEAGARIAVEEGVYRSTFALQGVLPWFRETLSGIVVSEVSVPEVSEEALRDAITLRRVSFRSGAYVGSQRLAVAIGTLDETPPPTAAETGSSGAVGFRYDGATGSDAFWTREDVPRKLAGAERAWFLGNGWAFVGGPVYTG